MKYLLIFLLIIGLFYSCKQSIHANEKIINQNVNSVVIDTSLSDTRWEYKISEDCINYLEFEQNGIYYEFNCEFGEKWEGNYQINADTLILFEITNTSNVPGKGEKIYNEYRMLLSPKGLHVVYSRVYEDGNWKESWIKEPEIFFKRLQ